VVRRCRGLDQPVVLAGSWAAGEVVVAAEPLVVETRAADFLRTLDHQPPVEGTVADGALGGGWFGWLGFEGDGCAFGFYPNVLRLSGGVWWDEALVGLVPDSDLERRRQRLSELLDAPPAKAQAYRIGPVTASRNRAEHTAAVERCIQYIRAGEIYQANICLTLQSDFSGSAADLGADLFSATQPPYGAYLALGEQQVASASPELFVRRSGRLVTSTPIKGTRPRTAITAEAERHRLAGSQKDRAENVMIVDLVRNDLSRVAETGSVRVSRLLDVVAAPGVWHLSSSIEARLPELVSDGDLLRATFPPGSVSGAPKSRAVEIIAELEDRPRGVYTGAIGYASPAYGAEFSVGIRTAQIRGGRFSLGVGGGITVDSTPLQEWWECFDKARPLLAAVGGEVFDPLSRRSARDPLAECGICDTSLLRYGIPRERAEHLARLERAYYELYERPLPGAAADALLRTPSDPEPWLRQRIDVAADGAVTVVRGVVPAPVPLAERPGEEAVLIPAQTGFGAYKWSERQRQEELEAAYPGKIVMLGDAEGLLETTRANVFAVVGDRLVTPPLDGRVLPGVTRTILLELAPDMGVEIELRVPGLGEARALAVASSVAGMRWIERCGDVVWATPGDLLDELSRRLVTRWAGGVTVAR
jgi:para-aminobenzoate synthetase/4-amino-4-deoxychorismate lyase